MIRGIRAVLVCLLSCALLASPASAAPDRTDAARQKFTAGRRKILFDAGTERAKLGVWCRDSGLAEDCLDVWSGLVRDTDKPLVFDDKGSVVIPSGTIPEDVSARMKAAALSVNGQLYLRDAFLQLVPDVKEVREAAGEHVRVR